MTAALVSEAHPYRQSLALDAAHLKISCAGLQVLVADGGDGSGQHSFTLKALAPAALCLHDARQQPCSEAKVTPSLPSGANIILLRCAPCPPTTAVRQAMNKTWAQKRECMRTDKAGIVFRCEAAAVGGALQRQRVRKEDCSISAPRATCGFCRLLARSASVQFCGRQHRLNERSSPSEIDCCDSQWSFNFIAGLKRPLNRGVALTASNIHAETSCLSHLCLSGEGQARAAGCHGQWVLRVLLAKAHQECVTRIPSA